MSEDIELVFTREGMKIRKSVELLGEIRWVEELIPYEKIRRMNGMELLIDSIEPEIERGVLVSLKFHVKRYTPFPTGRRIEIKLKGKSWRKYGLIPLPKRYREYFPGYKIPFILETDIGEIKTKVTSAPRGTPHGDPEAGNVIQGGLRPWYDRHRELREGDILIIEIIEPMRRYKLSYISRNDIFR